MTGNETTSNGADGVITILMLSANPTNTDRLRLDKEFREIQEGLKRSKLRDKFKLVFKLAVRPIDFQRAIEDEAPQIVHFSGHGAGEPGIILEDETGKAHLVPTEALTQLFELYKDQVECVVLNACFTASQAKAIGQHIGYVTGSNRGIKDKSAIDFSIGFYDALWAGRDYEKAFNLGCAAISFGGDVPGSRIPVLIQKSELNSQSSEPIRRKVFISYKRDSATDEAVVQQIRDALQKANHTVFIDKSMPVGEKWAKRIKNELRQSDYLITLLSAKSVASEMVKGEIETAHQLVAEQGKPKILPVRLGYKKRFPEALGIYLNELNWAIWNTDEDTSSLIEQLLHAIQDDGDVLPNDSNGSEEIIESNSPDIVPPSPDSPLEKPFGIVSLSSKFYVERDSDRRGLNLIQKKSQAIVIRGPEKVGKSSLLLRLEDAAKKLGKKVAHLDFEDFDQFSLISNDQFYREFCRKLTDELKFEDRIAQSWIKGVDSKVNCRRYVESHILPRLEVPLVISMEGLHKLYKLEFCSEFFTMVRAWYVGRFADERWQQLDYVMTVPPQTFDQIIGKETGHPGSPFDNIAESLELKDFTPEQVTDLLGKYNLSLSIDQQQQLMDLLGGHPFLIHRSFYLIADHQFTFDSLLEEAASDDGPFGDHLRYQVYRLVAKHEDWHQAFETIIRYQTCENTAIVFDLISAGLVLKDKRTVRSRCRLYEKYFQEEIL